MTGEEERAHWLHAAADAMRPWFVELGRPLPPCRFVATLDDAPPNVRRTAAGTCRHLLDGTAEISVSALVDAATPNGRGHPGVLAVLLHELVHAALPPEEVHGRRFGALMRRLGFWRCRMGGRGKTLDIPRDPLRARLLALAEELGPYPSAAGDRPTERRRSRPAQQQPERQGQLFGGGLTHRRRPGAGEGGCGPALLACL